MAVEQSKREDAMTITCFIHYEIDPFKREAFERYAQAWPGDTGLCSRHDLPLPASMAICVQGRTTSLNSCFAARSYPKVCNFSGSCS